MAEFKVHNLWPVPVYEDVIPVKQEWKDYIINTEYKRTHINNSDISTDFYILNSLPELKKQVEIHCDRFIRKYLTVKDNAKFYLQNSWSNIHNPNEYSQIHYHASALLSGVYYPILPKNSGNIAFHRGNLQTNIFHQSIRFEYEENNNLTAEKYVLPLKEGTIIIFPSHLDHSVERNSSSEKRYSIAFNLYVRGKFGKEEYELEIK
jgi:uncharacterized protein (TIGR02466 family)